MHIIESAVRQLSVKFPGTEIYHSKRIPSKNETKEKDNVREILLLTKFISYYRKNSQKRTYSTWHPYVKL